MSNPSKILVVQPSWVGDAVMATPLLRALRQLYPQAHIAYLMRRYLKPIYAGIPWMDQIITFRSDRTRGRAGRGLFDLAGRLRSARFDAAILLPNSFQSALTCKMARIPRVIGYERDGRSFLLTDRLLPVKKGGKFVPTPLIGYYMGLAHYLGYTGRDYQMELFVTPAERRRAGEILAHAGLDAAVDRPQASGKAPLVLLNPGANAPAKIWPAEYFAEVADRLAEDLGATILISGAPRERAIIDSIRNQMKHPAIDLTAHGMTLGALKDITRRSDLMITNDTGPRHIAAAVGTPVITLFGPTDPHWTEINFPHERQLSVKVFCGPCAKKKCPLDHRCMARLIPTRVYDTARELLTAAPTAAER